ncbi:MAG: tetratricopeptide repeat protein, partial [Xanthomonadales bacterium]|nr:tetratricopeptide repeat protein [Xanthomonadales bacterium]
MQAEEKATITLNISAEENLAIDWDHSKNYRLQLPNDLEGNWLLIIEQQGVNVVPRLINKLGEDEISVDIPIDSVGIERLVFSADVINGATVALPLVDKVTSPGGLKISLQAIANPQLFLLLRQLMVGAALLKNKDLELPRGIACETAIDGFNQDPGRAAHCFKAARENYKPEFKTIIEPEELDYYLADSVRRQTLLSDAQRLYLPLIRQQDDLRVQALALHGLAWTVWRSGEHKVGEAFANQAVSVYELWQQRDPNNLGIGYQQFSARNIACLIQHDQQQLENAERCYLELLTEVRAANDQNTEHLLIGNLGGIYYQRGDIARAREQFNKSYDLYTRI